MNLNGNGVLPVFILSSVGFDAHQIDGLGVRMGVDGAVGAQPAHGGGHQGHIPVNDDPNDDINVLVLHFPYGALGIPDTAVA